MIAFLVGVYVGVCSLAGLALVLLWMARRKPKAVPSQTSLTAAGLLPSCYECAVAMCLIQRPPVAFADHHRELFYACPECLRQVSILIGPALAIEAIREGAHVSD